MGARLKDVAAALGLSISTVSAALHRREDINQATRERVLQKAAELNYQPNRLAHGLATQKTHVLGIVVPNLSRPFFPQVLEGIDAITYPAGYSLVVFNTDDNPTREEKGDYDADQQSGRWINHRLRTGAAEKQAVAGIGEDGCAICTHGPLLSFRAVCCGG